jgi:hypothetical protein
MLELYRNLLSYRLKHLTLNFGARYDPCYSRGIQVGQLIQVGSLPFSR